MGNFLKYTYDYTPGRVFQSLTPNICLWSKYFSYKRFASIQKMFNALYAEKSRNKLFRLAKVISGRKYLQQFLFLPAGQVEGRSDLNPQISAT